MAKSSCSNKQKRVTIYWKNHDVNGRGYQLIHFDPKTDMIKDNTDCRKKYLQMYQFLMSGSRIALLNGYWKESVSLTCRKSERSRELDSVLFAELCDRERSSEPSDLILPLSLRNFIDDEYPAFSLYLDLFWHLIKRIYSLLTCIWKN